MQTEGRPHTKRRNYASSPAMRSSKLFNFNGSGTENYFNSNRSPSEQTSRRHTQNQWINCNDQHNKKNRRCLSGKSVQFPGDENLDYDYATDYETRHKSTDFSTFPQNDDVEYDAQEDIRPENSFARNNKEPINDNTRFNKEPINEEIYLKQTISKCQKSGLTYCEDEYPPEYKKYISNILKREAKPFEHFFTNTTPSLNDTDTLEVQHRFGRAGYEISVCNIKRHYIFPTAAITEENEWATVINEGRFRQAVLAEYCEEKKEKKVDTKGDGESLISRLLPIGYTAECQQKYQRPPMVTYLNGIVETKRVKLPSHCALVLFKNF